MADGVYAVDTDAPDRAARRAAAALPAHLTTTDDGRVRCRDCAAAPQLRPVVHDGDCAHAGGGQ